MGDPLSMIETLLAVDTSDSDGEHSERERSPAYPPSPSGLVHGREQSGHVRIALVGQRRQATLTHATKPRGHAAVRRRWPTPILEHGAHQVGDGVALERPLTVEQLPQGILDTL